MRIRLGKSDMILGVIIQLHQNLSQSPSSARPPDSLLSLRPILDASHNRNRRVSPPDSNCLAGTRRKVLEDLRSWVERDVFTERDHVLWLCGPVGCGKSAILQTISEEFSEKRKLLGSFFFFRGHGDRSRISRLAVTLASQMAVAIPKTAPLVEATLRQPFGLQGASVTAQFQHLIWSPLLVVFPGRHTKPSVSERLHRSVSRSSNDPHGPFLVVIDGLDECEDYEDVAEFIDQLFDFFARNPHFPLRFIIASRVEEHIRKRIQRNEVRLENLRNHIPDDDILKVVRHAFKAAAQSNLVIRSHGKEWPSEEDVRALIKRADGSFVFIRTMLDFILGSNFYRSDGTTPMDRFEIALGMNLGLDGLYTNTLQRAQDIPEFQDVVLTLALLLEPLSISLLSRLLNIPRSRIVHVLIPLQSIIHIPEDDETNIAFFHTSLRDFLLQAQRSAHLFPPGVLQRQIDRMAYRCLHHSVTLASSDVRHITEPLTLLEHHWARYWKQLDGQRVGHHFDFLSSLARQVLPAHIYDMACVFFYARTEGIVTDADVALYRDHFLLRSQSRVEDILLQAFAYLATMSAGAVVVEEHLWSSSTMFRSPARLTQSDPATHRSAVEQAMHYVILGSGGTNESWVTRLRGYCRRSTRPNVGNYDYALENWAFHLGAAVTESTSLEEVDSLMDFLQERYKPTKGEIDVSRYRVRKVNFDSNLEAATRVLYDKVR